MTDSLEPLRRELRKLSGSWTAFADEAGVSRRTIYRLLTGRNVPSWGTVEALNAALRRRGQQSPQRRARKAPVVAAPAERRRKSSNGKR